MRTKILIGLCIVLLFLSGCEEKVCLEYNENTYDCYIMKDYGDGWVDCIKDIDEVNERFNNLSKGVKLFKLDCLRYR